MAKWTSWFSSPDGFRGSPGFMGLCGLLVLGYALFGLVAGEVHVGRGSSAGPVLRATQPGFYWFVVLSLGALGAGLLAWAWNVIRLRERDGAR